MRARFSVREAQACVSAPAGQIAVGESCCESAMPHQARPRH